VAMKNKLTSQFAPARHRLLRRRLSPLQRFNLAKLTFRITSRWFPFC